MKVAALWLAVGVFYHICMAGRRPIVHVPIKIGISSCKSYRILFSPPSRCRIIITLAEVVQSRRVLEPTARVLEAVAVGGVGLVGDLAVRVVIEVVNNRLGRVALDVAH